MANVVLFDTDVLIDAGRGRNEAVGALREAAQQGRLAVSIVTEMELIVGCRDKGELKALDQFLRRFEVVTIGEAISQRATLLLRQYRLSHGLLIPDALIAATAVVNGYALITKSP